MPDKDMSSIKDEKLYEKLRDEGNSKEKAARISNAAANEGESTVARRGRWPLPRNCPNAAAGSGSTRATAPANSTPQPR